MSSQEALEASRRLAKEEGLFVGISSGATCTAALKVGQPWDAATWAAGRPSCELPSLPCPCAGTCMHSRLPTHAAGWRSGSRNCHFRHASCPAPPHTRTPFPAAPARPQVAARPENHGKRIVVMFASIGERYLSTKLFEDLYVEAKEQGFEPWVEKLPPGFRNDA